MTTLTRREIHQRHGVPLATLETWYRRRAVTGHPESVGTRDGLSVWDAREWERWHRELRTWAELAPHVGRSVSTLRALWQARAENGHPEPAKRVGGRLYWEPDEYVSWFQNDHLPSLRRAGRPLRLGDGDDEITLSEAARELGLPPTSITMYPKRPPEGWPNPISAEELPSGRVRRRYRRADIWQYAERGAHPGGGRPPGRTERRYPYDGDTRLDIARDALAGAANQSGLAARLAAEHGGTAGTWSHILTAARRHPTP